MLETDAVVGIEGRLCWRSTVDRHGEKKAGLTVLARALTVLASAAIEAAV